MQAPFFATFFHIIPPAFGLDISDTALKFVQLRKRGDVYFIDQFGERDMPRGIVEGGVIKRPKQLVKILSEALKGKKFAPYVISAIPDEEIFLSEMQLPVFTDTDELRNAVRVEAEVNIPIDLEEAYMDYEVIHKDGKQTSHTDVMVAVSRKRVVDSYHSLLQDVGLTPLALEPESLAIARSVIKGGRVKAPILILEIGANRTRLIVFENDAVIAAASLPFSSRLLEVAIVEKFNVNVASAAQLLRAIGLLESREHGTKVRLAIAPLLNKFLEDIGRHVAFFNKERTEEEHHALQIDGVFLSGGGSYIAGIEKYLGVGLKLSVSKTNPLVNIEAEKSKAYKFMRGQSLRYTVALGTAIRGAEGDTSRLFEKR